MSNDILVRRLFSLFRYLHSILSPYAIVLPYLPRLLIQFCLTVTDSDWSLKVEGFQHPVGDSPRNETTGSLSIYSLQSKHSLDSEDRRTREYSRFISWRLRTESKAPWVARDAIE